MMEMLERYEKAAKLICYCPESGAMTWRPRFEGANFKQWNLRYANRECGKTSRNGYRMLTINIGPDTSRLVLAHRFAWFVSYGAMPNGEIDHINQNRSDNRLINLRDVSRSINHRNRTLGRNNTSGVMGVTWNKRVGKWQAQVTLLNNNNHLGLFSELTEAAEAVRTFRNENDFTETHGRPTP